MDFFLDANWKVYLLEINLSPAVTHTDDARMRVQTGVVRDLVAAFGLGSADPRPAHDALASRFEVLLGEFMATHRFDAADALCAAADAVNADANTLAPGATAALGRTAEGRARRCLSDVDVRNLWAIFDQQAHSTAASGPTPRQYHKWVGIYPPLAGTDAPGQTVAQAAKRYERFFVGGLGWRNQLALHWTDFVVDRLSRTATA